MVMTTDYWATPPMRRDQSTLFAPTLDDMIDPDDPVRLFDEVLAGRDWSDWEAEYDLSRGQPPIHPRHVAACLLYGMARGIRSSRKLEESCCYRVDFLWLLEGRRIDPACEYTQASTPRCASFARSSRRSSRGCFGRSVRWR